MYTTSSEYHDCNNKFGLFLKLDMIKNIMILHRLTLWHAQSSIDAPNLLDTLHETPLEHQHQMNSHNINLITRTNMFDLLENIKRFVFACCTNLTLK